jgi:hypothetical protein
MLESLQRPGRTAIPDVAGRSARVEVGASPPQPAALTAPAMPRPRPEPAPRRSASVTTTTAVPITRPDQITAPASAAEAAAALVRVERGLRGDDRSRETLQRLGWEQQRVYGTLAANEAWIAPVLAVLPDDVRTVTQSNLDAGRGLQVLVEAQPGFPDWTIMSPPPADQLRLTARAAQFRIPGRTWRRSTRRDAWVASAGTARWVHRARCSSSQHVVRAWAAATSTITTTHHRRSTVSRRAGRAGQHGQRRSRNHSNSVSPRSLYAQARPTNALTTATTSGRSTTTTLTERTGSPRVDPPM